MKENIFNHLEDIYSYGELVLFVKLISRNKRKKTKLLYLSYDHSPSTFMWNDKLDKVVTITPINDVIRRVIKNEIEKKEEYRLLKIGLENFVYLSSLFHGQSGKHIVENIMRKRLEKI